MVKAKHTSFETLFIFQIALGLNMLKNKKILTIQDYLATDKKVHM